MTLEELSEDERQELVEMYHGMGEVDMISIALLAKYSPEDFDRMIKNIKEVQDYFEDMQYFMQTCNDETSTKSMERRITQVEQQLELLRNQRDARLDSPFY